MLWQPKLMFSVSSDMLWQPKLMFSVSSVMLWQPKLMLSVSSVIKRLFFRPFLGIIDPLYR